MTKSAIASPGVSEGQVSTVPETKVSVSLSLSLSLFPPPPPLSLREGGGRGGAERRREREVERKRERERGREREGGREGERATRTCENRRIGVVKRHSIDGAKVGKIVFVRGVVSMPRNNIIGGAIDDARK
jgi:hypothetical protein